MNPIVSMMANGAKSDFSKQELRKIKSEANRRFRRLTEENKGIPKALQQHTQTNIFPAIAVYKTLTEHVLLHKNLKWARTGTIGNGAPCCDFRIIDTLRCPDYRD